MIVPAPVVSERQRVGLRTKVPEELVVVFALPITDAEAAGHDAQDPARVAALACGSYATRAACTRVARRALARWGRTARGGSTDLVQQLVERVLARRARLAEDHLARRRG